MKFVFAMGLLMLTACSNPFGGADSVVDPAHRPGVTGNSFQPAPASALVNSSEQLKVSGRGYKISQTVGELTQETQSTTPRGYKFYSSIQGSLNSESAQ